MLRVFFTLIFLNIIFERKGKYPLLILFSFSYNKRPAKMLNQTSFSLSFRGLFSAWKTMRLFEVIGTVAESGRNYGDNEVLAASAICCHVTRYT